MAVSRPTPFWAFEPLPIIMRLLCFTYVSGISPLLARHLERYARIDECRIVVFRVQEWDVSTILLLPNELYSSPWLLPISQTTRYRGLVKHFASIPNSPQSFATLTGKIHHWMIYPLTIWSGIDLPHSGLIHGQLCPSARGIVRLHLSA